MESGEIQVRVPFKFGERIIHVTAVGTEVEVLRRLAFWDSLPEAGPEGQKDLKFNSYQTKEKYEYFQIVSKSAKKRLELGQSKVDIGNLFTKNWVDLFQPNPQKEEAPPQTQTVPENTTNESGYAEVTSGFEETESF